MRVGPVGYHNKMHQLEQHVTRDYGCADQHDTPLFMSNMNNCRL